MAKTKMKPWPRFETDEQAHEWLESANLAEYDLSGGLPAPEFWARVEAMNKDTRVDLRLPGQLVEGYRAKAARTGMSYQKLMRQVLIKGLG